MNRQFAARVPRHAIGRIHRVGLAQELDPTSRPATLPLAAVVVARESDGGVELLRYTCDGQFAGDTWHATLADAFEQGSDEYDIAESDWREQPSDVDPEEIVNTNCP